MVGVSLSLRAAHDRPSGSVDNHGQVTPPQPASGGVPPVGGGVDCDVVGELLRLADVAESRRCGGVRRVSRDLRDAVGRDLPTRDGQLEGDPPHKVPPLMSEERVTQIVIVVTVPETLVVSVHVPQLPGPNSPL